MKNRENREFVQLALVGEFGEAEGILGAVHKSHLEKLVKIAEKLELSCLKGIDPDSDTYFNYLQIDELLKNELKKLREVSELDPELIKMIEKGAKQVSDIQGFSYLKITRKN